MSNDLPEGGEQIINEFLQSLREAGESPEFKEEHPRRPKRGRRLLTWVTQVHRQQPRSGR